LSATPHHHPPYPVSAFPSGIGAEDLARTLLSGRVRAIAWGGRTRLLVATDSPTIVWQVARNIPAFRRGARFFANLLTWRAFLIPPLARSAETTSALDLESLGARGLRPVAALIGTPGPKQTLVLIFTDALGKLRAAMKIPVGPASFRAIENERVAITQLNGSGLAPTPIATNELQVSAILTTAFVAGRFPRTSGFDLYRIHALCQAIVESAPQARTSRLGDLPWLDQALSHVNPNPGPIRRSLRERVLIGRIHGDLAPWNVRITQAGRPVAIDWEASSLNGVAGLDFSHYLMAVERYLHHGNPHKALQRAATLLHRVAGYSESLSLSLAALSALWTAQRELDWDAAADVSYWLEAAASASNLD
jgi:hypothetical protein